jgi:hypothetical protein
MGTREQWAKDVLSALGNSTPSAKTVSLLASWTKGEDTQAKYNPLATTLKYGDYTKFNNCCGGNGVKNYKTRQMGIEATIQTLSGNHTGYSDIVAGFKGNDPERALRGMKASPWGTNFAYVENVWRTQNVGSEQLKAEDSTPPKIYGEQATQPAPNVPVHTPERLPLSGVNPLGSEAGYYDPNFKTAYPDEGVSGDSVRNFVKIYFVGIPLIGTAIILFIIAGAKSDTAQQAISLAKGVL